MTQKEIRQLAKQIRDATIERVGGSVAWSRMAYDARWDLIMATAGREMYRRWRPEMEDIFVMDVALAVRDLSRLDEDDL